MKKVFYIKNVDKVKKYKIILIDDCNSYKNNYIELIPFITPIN